MRSPQNGRVTEAFTPTRPRRTLHDNEGAGAFVPECGRRGRSSTVRGGETRYRLVERGSGPR